MKVFYLISSTMSVECLSDNVASIKVYTLLDEIHRENVLFCKSFDVDE